MSSKVVSSYCRRVFSKEYIFFGIQCHKRVKEILRGSDFGVKYNCYNRLPAKNLKQLYRDIKGEQKILLKEKCNEKHAKPFRNMTLILKLI